jgi:hypothetical protein
MSKDYFLNFYSFSFKTQYSGIKKLNIRPETLKLVQERAGNTLEATGIDKDFLSRTQVSHLREKMDKWDNMNLKSFCRKKKWSLN